MSNETTKKYYLDIEGLATFWNKLKEYIPKLFSTSISEFTEEDKTNNTDSIVFVEDTHQIWHNNVYYGNGFFIGTKSEYDEAFKTGRIVNGTIVIITDETQNSSGETAILGTAILGKMILGKEK